MEEKIKELEELVKKYRNLAFKDRLTGVYNNNWFMYNIHKLDRHLAMVDINYLKHTNDTIGHREGDRLILRVVNRLKNSGLVVRTGGDEFIVLSHDLQSLVKLQEENSPEFAIGIVERHETTSISVALALADERMYKDKALKKQMFHVKHLE